MNAVKIFLGIILIAVVLFSGCTQEQQVGASCGTVTPGQNDACCADRNTNTAHPECVGEWKYSSTGDPNTECSWVCGQEQLSGASCGTVTPGYNDACCEERGVDRYGDGFPQNCSGKWKYSPTGDPKTECQFICDEPILGASCGTVTPGQNDACCADRNTNTIHPECVGEWKYSSTGDPNTECSWQCTSTGIANPASTYCVDSGYKLEIRRAATGEEYGTCIFSDKTECDEWEFFRSECGVKWRKNETSCTQEGGFVGGAPPAPGVTPRQCCGGLTQVPAVVPEDSGNCAQGVTEIFACTKCGDGTCGKGENHCNCQQDCQRVEGGACTMDYTPVCGSDGKTYGNACGAKTAGIGVDYAGECTKKLDAAAP